jgi:hypothetical protein
VFPSIGEISANAVGWLEQEVNEWVLWRVKAGMNGDYNQSRASTRVRIPKREPRTVAHWFSLGFAA